MSLEETKYALPSLVGGSSSQQGEHDPTSRMRPYSLEDFGQGFDECVGYEKIAIEFGRTVMPASHVRQLQDGQVLPLGEQVDDPVTLRLGDQVVARGEVILLDGKMGIRITEVV